MKQLDDNVIELFFISIREVNLPQQAIGISEILLHKCIAGQICQRCQGIC